MARVLKGSHSNLILIFFYRNVTKRRTSSFSVFFTVAAPEMSGCRVTARVPEFRLEHFQKNYAFLLHFGALGPPRHSPFQPVHVPRLAPGLAPHCFFTTSQRNRHRMSTILSTRLRLKHLIVIVADRNDNFVVINHRVDLTCRLTPNDRERRELFSTTAKVLVTRRYTKLYRQPMKKIISLLSNFANIQIVISNVTVFFFSNHHCTSLAYSLCI